MQSGEYGDLASERASEAAGNAGSDQVTAAYSHAYAAAAADAVTDISSEYRTNPFRIADEHADEVSRLEGEAMQRAFGRPTITPGTIEPGSVFTQDPAAKAILSQPQPEPVGRPQAAEFADLAHSADDAVHEAEQAHALTGGAKLEEAGAETPLHTELAAAEDAAHAEGYSPDMVKAIHAAVRCGLVKGLG